jgi:hypothetical protein
VAGVRVGEITAAEGCELSKLVDHYLRALEAKDFEPRLNMLEAESWRGGRNLADAGALPRTRHLFFFLLLTGRTGGFVSPWGGTPREPRSHTCRLDLGIAGELIGSTPSGFHGGRLRLSGRDQRQDAG